MSKNLATRTYPDGTHRPSVRGVLHGVLALGASGLAFHMMLAGDPRWELVFILFAKATSWLASFHLHFVDQHTPFRYAVANALDFSLLPFNGGCILAVATPRHSVGLRLTHVIVLAMLSTSVIRPVYMWTLCICAGDKKRAHDYHVQRTILCLLGGIWFILSWVVQAGFTYAWLGYLLMLLLGYASYSGQFFGMPPMPWHSQNWAAHDDFHVFGALADACAMAYAVPAAALL